MLKEIILNPDTIYGINIGRRQTDAGCHMTSLVEVIIVTDLDGKLHLL